VTNTAAYSGADVSQSKILTFRAKAAHDLDEEVRAIQEFEKVEKEILEEKASEDSAQPKKRFFKPLPEAEYT
jgi:hypothetical protein